MYSVILKVRGDGIKLWPHDKLQSQSLKILCHDLDARQDRPTSDVQVFVLADRTQGIDRSSFKNQQTFGQPISSTDSAIFRTFPIDSSRKASYALHLGASKLSTSMEDLSSEEAKKVGTAYLYLDPEFSTQGAQRLHVIGSHNSASIGQILVEYLIVKNPVGFNIQAPIPKWFSCSAQLNQGHRGSGTGCRADLPGSITENTIASFNYAARHGADMCELDVMCTADGVPIVYHNYFLEIEQVGTTQIDQLTLSQLRALKDSIRHDQNCEHTSKNLSPEMQRSSRPFPTLKEVLSDVDQSCGLNIELKWPQLLPNGENEAGHYREINDFTDRILDCIFKNSNGRKIVLSTFSADIAVMLRLKQTQYPVLFVTNCDVKRYNDLATKTVQSAVHFAQAFDLAGINPNAAHLTEYHVKYAQDRGLLVNAWGKIESAQKIKELRQSGCNGVIYDRIDLIKPQD